MQGGFGQWIHTHALFLVSQTEQHPLVWLQAQHLLSYKKPIPRNTVKIQKVGSFFIASQEFVRNWSTRRISTLLTTRHHLSLPWITWVQVQILPSCFSKIHFSIILQFVSTFYNQLSPSSSHTFSSPAGMLHSPSAHLVLLYLIIIWLEGRFMKMLQYIISPNNLIV